MKCKLNWMIAALAFAGSLLLTGCATTVEKTGKDIVSKSQKSRGAAADENIKSDAQPKNSLADEGKPGPGKEDSKARGICQIHVDNRTAWWIKIFIDGQYAGTVPPGGDLYPRAISGRTKFYARADFDDGSFRFWGPTDFDCGDLFTWTLNY